MSVTETALVAFTTYFATVGPVDVAALYAALTVDNTAAERRAMALKGTFVAAAILGFFAVAGNTALAHLGISLAALRTAGGILLLLIAIDLVFARSSGGVTATAAERREARARPDISVFPLGTPLIAGPGAIGATVLLMAGARDDFVHEAAVAGALVAVLLLQLALLMMAANIQKLLGVTGLNVISRVVGVLLAALSVQFIFDGIRASGIIPAAPGIS